MTPTPDPYRFAYALGYQLGRAALFLLLAGVTVGAVYLFTHALGAP